MKQLLRLIVFASTLGLVPAGADEAGFELASLQNAPGAALILTGRDDGDRDLIREEACDSANTVALIERNREDRERTVVMDR